MTIGGWVVEAVMGLTLCCCVGWGPRRFFRHLRAGWDWVSQRRLLAVIGMGLLGGACITVAAIGGWIVGASLALALCASIPWRPRRRFFRHLRAGWDWVSRRRPLAVIGMGLLGGAWSALMSLSWGLPEPAIHDEFSYLLMADTFAHGRLTNPPHPMGEFFETYHVLQQPTCASKYPPATGILLAAGWVFGGHPALGVWLGVALATGGMCWMMYGWLRPRWALLGGLLACVWIVPGYWSRSYWGGALAAFGGALVFGALRRIVREPGVRDSLLLGLGLAVLANTRPFEGLVISLPAAGALLGTLCGRSRPPLRLALGQVVLPLLGVLAIAGVAMGYYNHKVTGNFRLAPYQLYYQTTHEPPLFLWMPDPGVGPPLRTKVLEENSYGFGRATFLAQRSREGFLEHSWEKLEHYWKFYLGPTLALALITLPLLLRDRWMRFLLAGLGLLGVALLSETWHQPHYAAPGAGLLFVLVAQGLRTMSTMRGRTWRPGAGLVVGLLGIWLGTLAPSLVTNHENEARQIKDIRRPVLATLSTQSGLHLVIVRGQPFNRHHDWIHNAADVDGGRIVWARDLGSAKNEELLRYYKGRHFWLLKGDQQPPLLQLYSPE